MQYQSIFKRYEMKYLLNKQQVDMLLEVMKDYMILDDYGHTTIRNIYFDTPDFFLVRNSIDKPIYKEKLRVRSYQQATSHAVVFVEIKKKFESVVYKRRVALKESDATNWLINSNYQPKPTQIIKEINYFKQFYQNLKPVCFLSYERDAYYSKLEDDLRITIDQNVIYRTSDIDLKSEVYGKKLLDLNTYILEVKTKGGLPMWLCHFFSQHQIYKTTFSKYGEVYKQGGLQE